MKIQVVTKFKPGDKVLCSNYERSEKYRGTVTRSGLYFDGGDLLFVRMEEGVWTLHDGHEVSWDPAFVEINPEPPPAKVRLKRRSIW